jgi:hypothetical protein
MALFLGQFGFRSRSKDFSITKTLLTEAVVLLPKKWYSSRRVLGHSAKDVRLSTGQVTKYFQSSSFGFSKAIE